MIKIWSTSDGIWFDFLNLFDEPFRLILNLIWVGVILDFNEIPLINMLFSINIYYFYSLCVESWKDDDVSRPAALSWLIISRNFERSI